MTYSEKLLLKARLKLALILLSLVGIFIVNYHYGISKTSFTFKTFELLFSFFLGFSFFPVFRELQKNLFKIEDKILAEESSAKRGIEGEKEVAKWLFELLPKEKYTTFPNVKIPGYEFDIDFVVNGPKGIVLLEVKNYINKVIFENDNYLVKYNLGYSLCKQVDPRNKLRYYEGRFREYLADNNRNKIKINSAIVFLKEDAAWIEGETGMFIIRGREALKKYIQALYDDENYSPELGEKLNALLKKLATGKPTKVH